MSLPKRLKKGSKVRYSDKALKRFPEGHSAFTAIGTMSALYEGVTDSRFYLIKWDNHIYTQSVVNLDDMEQV